MLQELTYGRGSYGNELELSLMLRRSLLLASKSSLRVFSSHDDFPEELVQCSELREVTVPASDKLGLLQQLAKLAVLTVQCSKLGDVKLLSQYLDQGRIPQRVRVELTHRVALGEFPRLARSFHSVKVMIMRGDGSISEADVISCLRLMPALEEVGLPWVLDMKTVVREFAPAMVPRLRKLILPWQSRHVPGEQDWRDTLRALRPHIEIE